MLTVIYCIIGLVLGRIAYSLFTMTDLAKRITRRLEVKAAEYDLKTAYVKNFGEDWEKHYNADMDRRRKEVSNSVAQYHRSKFKVITK